MKTIGILGGLSPESSLEYYRQLITAAQKELPEGRYPEILIYSLNFEEFCKPMTEGKDEIVLNLLEEKISALKKAGADFALMASNTPHVFYDQLKRKLSFPLLSIVEATAEVADKMKVDKVGLLGTNFTMTGGFYETTFSQRDIAVVVPDKTDRDYVHKKIMSEMVNGKFLEETKSELTGIIRKLTNERNIEAIILGCTELPMILSEKEAGIPVLDTTKIHVDAAFDLAYN